MEGTDPTPSALLTAVLDINFCGEIGDGTQLQMALLGP